MVFNFRPESNPDDAVTATAPPQVYTWLIRFPTRAAFDAMQHAVTSALFEGKWGAGAWNKLKDDEREYANKAWIEDAEMEDQFVEEEDEEEEDGEDDEDEEDAAAGQSRAQDGECWDVLWTRTASLRLTAISTSRRR